MTTPVRAAVFTGPDRPLEIRSFPRPSPEAGQLLARVTCCTLCGSDLHTFSGRRDEPTPSILGHEILGEIAELPDSGATDWNGKPLQIGDRITWSVAASCGDCVRCRRGLPQKCEHLFKYGHQQVDDTGPLAGGLSEYCLLQPGTAMFGIPANIPDFVACPANCATATVAAAFRVAGDIRNKHVLIHGAGGMGLTATAMARHRGAAGIIIADLNAERLERARLFGATDTAQVDGDENTLASAVDRATDGTGCDVVFEMSGAPSAVEQSIELLAVGGQLVLVGSVFPQRHVEFAAEQIVRKLLRIEGVHNYTPSDLDTALLFLEQTGAPFGDFVGAEFSLDEVNAAFGRALLGTDVRVAVRP